VTPRTQSSLAVTADGGAWLVALDGGRWWLEAAYD